MVTKTRLKDLATELGVNNKELLITLRELDIQVKSHMSSLTDEEVQQVKDAVKAQAAGSEVTRRVVQPGVVVRRRRGKKGAEAKKAEVEAVEETPVEEPAARATDTVAEEKAAEAVAEKAEPMAETEAAPEAPAEKPARKPAEEKPAVAKIVRTADQEAEAAAPAEEAVSDEPAAEEAPSPETAEVAEPEAEVKAEAAPVDEPPEEQAPEQKAEEKAAAPEADEAEKEAAPSKAEEAKKPEKAPEKKKADKAEKKSAAAEPEKKKKKKRTVDMSSGPQVRVISVPTTPPPPKSPRPERRGRPAGGRDSRPPAGRGRPGPGVPPPPPPSGKTDGRKRKKDRRVVEFGRQDTFDKKRGRGMDGDMPDHFRGKKKKGKRRGPDHGRPEAQTGTQPLKAAKRKIKVDETIRLSDMAKQMGLKAQELIKVLFGLGVMATINQSLDMDTATLVAGEFGYEIESVGFDEEEFLLPKEEDKPEHMKPRPPVVTIMGHVDHGKTSLLDAIRSTNVIGGEAGGITQHIGAYHVKTSRGELVFLDTPGHEAFTAMRARGAQVTDLVVLVVAADDGVMDQTREAINHSKAAEVPIVVAVNKIDKEDANPDRVKRELAEFDLVPEDWGGDTIFANVSAKQNQGIDSLLELILLQAEVLELGANPDKPARGHIVEAKVDKGRGSVGTVLIQEGSLNQGDFFVCGLCSGKVRAMFNDQGKKVKKAGPAMPMEVQGFDGVPEAGDEFVVVADEKVARRIAGTRQMKQRERELAGKSKVTLESFLASKPQDEAATLNVIIKADVQGSLEAITEAVNKLSTDEVKIKVLHGGAGAITESDILLASAFQAIILGFNVKPTAKVKDIAEQEAVEIRFYDVIYKLVNEIKDAMSGMLAPDIEEVYLGQAEVRETFSVPKVGTVAGCHVEDGKLTRNAGIRLLRDGVVQYTGTLASLRRFKDDVKEVAKGYECGVGLENYNDIKVGDVIEAFEEKEVARTLE